MKAVTDSKPDFKLEFRRFLAFLRSEAKPKGPLITPFNVITGAILVAGAIILFFRFAYGLGSVTNLTQDYPWGIWVGFDVITGVAFAGGAYVLTFVVYVLNVKKYHPIIRMVVLNGLLAYMFYAGALLLDLGRPWNVINPIIGNSFGVSSVLFLVAWHFLLYMTAEFIEFSPVVAEWLGWRRVRKVLGAATIGAVIFGISLSILHQSGLGALFLMAKAKIHPLWYSEFIPVLFLVSSVFSGLSMVIIEGTISHRVFFSKLTPEHHEKHDEIVFGLSRIAAGALFVYFFMKALTFIHGHGWEYMNDGWAIWYLVEVIGFVVIPMGLYMQGLKLRSLGTIRVAAGMALFGILLNRLNISLITFNYQLPVRYIPSWMEVMVTLAVISAEIWVLRWIVNRMPVVSEPPAWANEHGEDEHAEYNEPIRLAERRGA